MGRRRQPPGERRPHRPDAFHLSVGLAHQPWDPWPDDEGPASGSILADLGPLVDAVVVALGPGLAIGVVGPAPARERVLRWLVCQIGPCTVLQT
jgi:hypothetical protein